MAKLTSKERNALPSSAFVFPKTRKYPIEDAAHRKNALSRAGAQGGAVEKKVRAAVKKRSPRTTATRKNPGHYRHRSQTQARRRG